MAGELRPAIRQFLDACCPASRVVPIAGDASTRRFYRIVLADGGTRVLMDYGQGFRGETDDQKLTRIFEAADLPVAAILGASETAGCLLLEDLGPRSLEDALTSAAPDGTRALLEHAVDLAARVATRGTPVLADSDRSRSPQLDPVRFRFEMAFFQEHYAHGFCGLTRLPTGLAPALERLADSAAASPTQVLCHRDFHSRNVLVRDDGSLALVDIQDGRLGPDAYDLASLLRDAYVDIPEERIDPLIERFLAALDTPRPREEFRRRFFRVAAQRMIKALGTFGYQVHVLDRKRYTSAIPRTLARLRGLLPKSAETAELSELLDHAGLLDPPR